MTVTPAKIAMLERMKRVTYERQINWITGQPQDIDQEAAHRAELQQLGESLAQPEPITKPSIWQRISRWIGKLKI